MKLFDCDWAAIAAAAPKWDVLPVPCKALFLKHVEPDRPLEIRRIRADIHPLLQAEFLEPTPDQTHLALPASQRAFHRVVRAMARHSVFHAGYGKSPGLTGYLREHFSEEECFALLGRSSPWGAGEELLAAEAGQGAWIESFLAETDFRRWAQAHRSRGNPALLADAATFDRAKAVLRVLMHAPPHTTFPDLAKALGTQDLNAYGAALRALIGYVMAFPALVESAWQMGIGLWPAVHGRLHRATATSPACVTPARTFGAPFLADDMTMLLVACSAQPLRVRQSDGLLFARVREDMAGRLTSLPEWMTPVLSLKVDKRLSAAQLALETMGFTRIPRTAGTEPAMEPSAQGARWLRGSDGERLKHILAALRKDLDSKLDPFGDYAWSPEPRLRFADRGPDLQCDREPLDWRPAVVKAFADLPDSGHVLLGEFLDFQSREANPFIRLLREGRRLDRIREWHSGRIGEEELEREWRAVLESFLVSRLLPFGCTEIGVTEDNQTTIGLAAPGRYLLGRARGFDLGRPAVQDIVVQPNMEIVFLAHSPSAEATAARLAERVGHGVGVLFRITRRSVHEAFAAGWRADAVLDALGGLSRKPIPDNVATQVRDWAEQCRRVDVGSAVLFRCPDPETALRVLAAGGKKLERISDTVVAMTDRKALRDIEKKLRQNGITRSVRAAEEPGSRT